MMFDLYVLFVFFFFKQKTAYEMRISDWSSDVCSSDLVENLLGADRVDDIGVGTHQHATVAEPAQHRVQHGPVLATADRVDPHQDAARIGEARLDLCGYFIPIDHGCDIDTSVVARIHHRPQPRVRVDAGGRGGGVTAPDDRDTRWTGQHWLLHSDRKSTRLTSVTNAQLVCRLLLDKKNNNHKP